MTVDVIIPAYNSGRWIGRCLNSLIDQTYKDWTAIVVVAPSTDNTLDEVKSRGDPRIMWYCETRKTTCANARNIGLSILDNEYVTFLDADDYYEPDRLQEQVDFMDSVSDLDFCGTWLKVVNEDDEYVTTYRYGYDLELQGVNTIMFRRNFLALIRMLDGYVFNPNMDRIDDVDLIVRCRYGKYGLIPRELTVYTEMPTGLTYSKPRWYRDLMLYRIVIRNGAFSFLPSMVKETIAVTASKFGINLVRKHAS